MAGRIADPNTKYKVYLHKVANKYTYATVQLTDRTKDSTRLKYKPFHLGKIDSNNVFIPNAEFRMLPVSERIKYIFPSDIDISRIEALNNHEYANYELDKMDAKQETKDIIEDDVKSDSCSEPLCNNSSDMNNAIESSKANLHDGESGLAQYNNKLYGSFWLLEQITRQKGVYDDLLKTFQGNLAMVNEVISLAFYPYISGKCYSRFAKWQNAHKTLVDYPLTSPSITKLSQNITDQHRMTLIKLRLERQPEGALLDCDSTSKSGWGTCLVDLCWGNNKDNPKLQNTVEAFVYSLTTHEPVYYRSFPGNTSDISTVRTILSDLQALGINDVVFIADRGYPSEENLAALVKAKLAFLMCAKVGNNRIVQLLQEIKYDEDGVPTNMDYDEKRRLYYRQADIPTYHSKLADGTDVLMEGLKANLFLNFRDRAEELGALKRKIKEESDILGKAIKDKLIPNDIEKYNALFEYHKVTYENDENKKPMGIQYVICEKKVAKERALCGFFSSIMYKMPDVDGAKALEIYKSRDEHEKNFDQLKNEMMQYVQRNSSEDGRNGRSFISFVGLIAISKLRHAWKEKMQSRFASSLDMLDELESIRFSEYANGTTHMSSFTAKQVEVCDACEVAVPKECMPATLRKTKERQENPKKRGRKPKKSEEQ